MNTTEKVVTHIVYLFLILILVIPLTINYNKLLNLNNDLIKLIEAYEKELSKCTPPSARVTVTCYQSTPEQVGSDPFTTAFNDKVGPGTLAVSRDLLEIGYAPQTKVYLEGYGVFKVADVMGKKHRKRVDIWVPQSASLFKEENVLLVGYSNYLHKRGH